MQNSERSSPPLPLHLLLLPPPLLFLHKMAALSLAFYDPLRGWSVSNTYTAGMIYFLYNICIIYPRLSNITSHRITLIKKTKVFNESN